MKTVLVEDQERPLVWVDAPYDDSPDLAERFEAQRAARYVRLVGLFLALCAWVGAELATAFAFREFALAPLAAAACFGWVGKRLWTALA